MAAILNIYVLEIYIYTWIVYGHTLSSQIVIICLFRFSTIIILLPTSFSFVPLSERNSFYILPKCFLN